jgi:hypothetical protein
VEERKKELFPVWEWVRLNSEEGVAFKILLEKC